MIGCMLPTLCCPLDPLVWQKWTINLRFPKCGWPDRHTEWKTEGTPAMTVAWCTAKQLESKHSNIQYVIRSCPSQLPLYSPHQKQQHSADEKSTVNSPLLETNVNLQHSLLILSLTNRYVSNLHCNAFFTVNLQYLTGSSFTRTMSFTASYCILKLQHITRCEGAVLYCVLVKLQHNTAHSFVSKLLYVYSV